MADSLQARISLSCNTSEGGTVSASQNISETITDPRFVKTITTVGATDTEIPLGDVSTPGWLVVRNLGTTAPVLLGNDGSSYPVLINPGAACLVHWNGAAIHAVSPPAGNDVEVTLVDRYRIMEYLAAQSITFAPLSNRLVLESPLALSATATSGLPVAFSLVSGPASLTGSSLALTGPGTVVVRASQVGDAIYGPAANVDRSFVVGLAKVDQTITFAELPDVAYDVEDYTFALTGTATSGLAVTFAVVSGPATVSGGNLTITGTGEISISAAQAGDGYYNAAPTVYRTFRAKADQAITFAELAGKTYGDAPFTVAATASSGLPVTFSVESGPATIDGSTVTITGAGTAIIRASQAGDDSYFAAPDVDRSLVITKVDDEITFAIANLDYPYPDDPANEFLNSIDAAATTASGLPVTYTVVSGPATLREGYAGSLYLTGCGTVTVRAETAGNSNYNPATKEVTFTVAKVSLASMEVLEKLDFSLGTNTHISSVWASANGYKMALADGTPPFTISSGATVTFSLVVWGGGTIAPTLVQLASPARLVVDFNSQTTSFAVGVSGTATDYFNAFSYTYAFTIS